MSANNYNYDSIDQYSKQPQKEIQYRHSYHGCFADDVDFGHSVLHSPQGNS